MVAVGLLYRHGYFNQYLDADGWQRERYPDLNPHSLPLRRLEIDGEPTTVSVDLAGAQVAYQIWKADVGRVPLLLLDTDHPRNAQADREVTDRLYGGDTEHRLRQELVLGIGGVRALRPAIAMGEVPATPELFHSNEGHAGFLQLERVRSLINDDGLSFDEAVEAARAGVLFTTHTPVPAGIDKFPADLMRRYLPDVAASCGVSRPRPRPGPAHARPARAVQRGRARPAAVSACQRRVPAARAGLAPDVLRAVARPARGGDSDHVGDQRCPRLDVDRSRDGRPVRAPPRAGLAGQPAGLGPRRRDHRRRLWRARERARERMLGRVRSAVRAQVQRRGERATALEWTDDIGDPAR